MSVHLFSRRLSRTDAFREQGVSLKFPSSSWSGVRADDGMVVFALPANGVLSDWSGSRCLLWQPRSDADKRERRERLDHCRLALLRGGAEALLVYGEAEQVDREAVLAIRVERLHREYWARWGSRASPQAVRDTSWREKGRSVPAAAVFA
jgi:hypothetical protein